MLIQPHIENAIWHGLRYKKETGFLKLSFSLDNKMLIVKIEDDRIGLQQSQVKKTTNQKIYQSRGLSNMEEKIKLLNQLYHLRIRFEIREKK